MQVGIERLLESLKQHEGVRLKPYKCTAGKLTIGVGRNLDDVGITDQEADMMLLNDTMRCIRECRESFAMYNSLDAVRQDVVTEMCFNLGINRLKQFKKFFLALEAGNYEVAGREMLDSRWARQVGQRAKTLSERMRKGVYE